MAKTLTPIELTDTFSVLIAQVNSLIDAISTEIVTANNEANGSLTTGNTFINGTFSATSVAVNTLRGGNVQSSNRMNIVSDVYMTNSTTRALTIGNSTVNSVANSSTLKFANSTTTYQWVMPTAAQISAAVFTYFSDGTWAETIRTSGSSFEVTKPITFYGNSAFVSNATFNANVTFNQRLNPAAGILTPNVNVNGSIISGNSTQLTISTNVVVNGTVAYDGGGSFTDVVVVNNQTISANSDGFTLNPRVFSTAATFGNPTTAYSTTLIVSDGLQRFVGSSATTDQRIIWTRTTGDVAWLGSPNWDPDSFRIYGPKADGTGVELSYVYTQENHVFYSGTSGIRRLTIDENGYIGLGAGASNPAKHLVLNYADGTSPTIRLMDGTDGHYTDLIYTPAANDFAINVLNSGGNDFRINSNGDIKLAAEGSAGNVAIGNAAEVTSAKLLVQIPDNNQGVIVRQANNTNTIFMRYRNNTSTKDFATRYDAPRGNFQFRSEAGPNGDGDLWQTFKEAGDGRGYVGFGTPDPFATVDIAGTFRDSYANTYMQTLADGATISWNCQAHRIATVTLGGNRTITASSRKVGYYTLHVNQDSTGGRSLTWGSEFKFPNGNPPVLNTAPNSKSVFHFHVGNDLNLYSAIDYTAPADPAQRVWHANSGGSATGLTEFEFTNIPTDVQEIDVYIWTVSLAANQRVFIQLGDSGGYESSDYKSVAVSSTGSTLYQNTNAPGFTYYTGATTFPWTLVGHLFRYQNSNRWFFEGQGTTYLAGISDSSGYKELSANLDRVKLYSTGTGVTFTDGIFYLAYKTT